MTDALKQARDALSDAAKRLVINYNRNEAPEWEDIEAVHDAALLIRAAIARADAAQAAPVAGWRLVPVEPTDAMVDATHHGQPVDDIWRDMLAAAPPAPAAQPLTECNDNDSPWLVRKPCAAAGKCARAAVTEAMVTAYLMANDAYWKRVDAEPTKLGKWRNGTPSEATRVSLAAALQAAQQEPAQADARDALPPVEGDVLPPIGSTVLIHLASSCKWVPHTVVGYYVWPNHGLVQSVFRVFVRVRSADGYLNARCLQDIRYPDDAAQAKPAGGA